MAVRIYNKGEHPAGFVGVRVARTIGSDKKYKQKYFSFRKPNKTGYFNKSEQSQIIEKANKLDEQWKAEADKHRLEQSLITEYQTVKPFAGVGFQGITLVLASREKNVVRKVDGKKCCYNSYQPTFSVNLCRPAKRFNIGEQCSFSDAWRQAVNYWARLKQVPESVRLEKLNNPPHPDQFKQLRRYLNAKGADIPVKVLHWVYAEQRQRVKNTIVYNSQHERGLPGL